MNSTLLYLTLFFLVINIIQTWLIFSSKSLKKGGLVIGLIEAVEFSLMIYLTLERIDDIFTLSHHRNSSMVEYRLFYNKKVNPVRNDSV